ncbi:type II toxin-antitoxin system Phd/YefM family antitoxin [Nocardioides sp. BGMRC 2183]|nr:type II toxin-antitoxin system Phd/YefM family antitoxin [Nocardioides sp. BGMRC 2183]
MRTTVNVQEAKTRLSELLKRVEAGEAIVIARAGKPVAELTPVRKVDLVFGGFDLVVDDDFFAPLPEEELSAWEGRTEV